MQLDNLFEVIKTAGQKPFAYFVSRSTSASIQSNSVYDFMSAKGFVFNQFKSLEDAFEKKNKIKSKSVKQRYETDALGYVSSPEFDDYKSFTNYLNSPRASFIKIKEISSKFIENVKTLINLGGLFKNDKITITEDTRGVFDFGLASLGLYRPIEFYSKELADDIENGILKNPFSSAKLENGVVDGDNVKKKVISNLNIFSYEIDGKKYNCERRQKGVTKVFNNFSDECFLKPDKDGLLITYYLNNKEKVFNGKGDIKLKFLIQLLACSINKKKLIYNTNSDQLNTLYDSIKHFNIIELYIYIINYNEFN